MKVKYKTGRWVVRMAMWLPLIVLSVAMFLSCSSDSEVESQTDELAALRKDYPGLTERYGAQLEGRTAHYIFAIDISSSMDTFKETMRESLINFVNAVPDGNRISIVLMSEKEQTDFLNGDIKCVTLNDALRQEVVDALRSSRFNSKYKDGSDGYTMTSKVLEAMKVVGNNGDLTFVYMLTDFVYWTNLYKYKKNKEDWDALKGMLPDKHRGLLCGYGIQLNFKEQEKHPEAVFKPELDMIFGPVVYKKASSVALLEEWFKNITNDIRANKINVMLKEDWTTLSDNRSLRLKSSGASVNLKVKMPKSDLINGYHASAVPVDHFDARPDAKGEIGWYTNLGKWQRKHRNWWPCFTRVGGGKIVTNITYNSPYSEEIARLQDHCCGKNGDRLELTEQATLEVPTTWAWNSSVPIPVWALIILLLLAAVASVVYTLTRKYDKRLSFTVYLPGGQLPCSGDTKRYPYTIGDGCTLDVPGAIWKARVETSKGIWLAFGLKGGYYLTLLAGSRATLYNNRNDKVQATLRRGQKTLLFGRNNKKPLRLEIDEDGMGNITTIEIN